MPKVSIIMGIYNCAETLQEAIDSILAQTYGDWELIMCDDGSTDSTLEIAMCNQRIVGRNKIILLKNENNMGLNYTLNKCLSVANGEYIARMDGDDISLPARLEKEVMFLDNHPEYAIVSTPMIFFDNHGEWGRSYAIQTPVKKDFIRHSPVFCHAPCMVRKRAYLDVGGYTVDPKILRFEDVNLWYKLYAKGYIGFNLSEPLYKMRNDISASQRRTLKSRINGVYVTYIGFKLFEFPWYYNCYVGLDLCKHLMKAMIPSRIRIWIRKKQYRK